MHRSRRRGRAERLFAVLDAPTRNRHAADRSATRAQGRTRIRPRLAALSRPGSARRLHDISFSRATRHRHRDRRPLGQRQEHAGAADPALLRADPGRAICSTACRSRITGSPTCAAQVALVGPARDAVRRQRSRANIAYGQRRRSRADCGGGARRERMEFVERLPDGHGHAQSANTARCCPAASASAWPSHARSCATRRS